MVAYVEVNEHEVRDAWSCYFVATQKNQNRFSWQVSCVSGSQWVFFLFNYSKSCDFGISAHLIFVLRGVICGTEDCHLEFYDLFLALELCMWTNSFPQTTAEDRQQLSWLTTPSLHCLFRPPSFTSICLTIFLFPVIAFFLAFHFCTHSSGSNAARIHQPCINSFVFTHKCMCIHTLSSYGDTPASSPTDRGEVYIMQRYPVQTEFVVAQFHDATYWMILAGLLTCLLMLVQICLW